MLDKIYEDFTTKVLPELSKGLVITKDYFADVFGRYIKYIIIRDSLALALCLTVLAVCIFTFSKALKILRSNKGVGRYDENDAYIPMFMLSSFIGIASIAFSIAIVNEILLANTVPEIVIYQQLSDVINHR